MTTTTSAAAQTLAQRADEFRDVLLQVAADEHGVVRSLIHADPPRPLRDADITSGDRLHQSSRPADFHAYEDAGMTTGAMLAAQCLRYRVTAQRDDLQDAHRLFAAVRHIYDLGAAYRQPGYFPKPYGGQPSDQISRDQYLYIMCGLTAYLPLADDATRRHVTQMMRHLARYWVSIQYTSSYFGLPAASHLDDFMGSLFLGIIHMGLQASGDAALAAEYQRLNDQHQLDTRMSQTLREHFRQGGRYDGSTYFRQQENPIAMKSMAIDHLWEADPRRRPTWADALRQFWRDDLLVPLNRTTSLNYYMVGYRRDDDSLFLTDPGVVRALQNPLKLSTLTWGGLRQSAASTQTAYAAAIIAHRLQLTEPRDIALQILQRLSLPTFTGWLVPDPQHIPPGHEWQMQTLRSCYLAYWQWTYWLGRNRGMW